jgi:hypothetical protein
VLRLTQAVGIKRHANPFGRPAHGNGAGQRAAAPSKPKRSRYSIRWPVAREGEGQDVEAVGHRGTGSAAIAPRLADLIAFAVLSREDTEPGT